MKKILTFQMLLLILSCQSSEINFSNNPPVDRIQYTIDSLRIINKINGVQFCIIDSAGNKKLWTSGYADNKKNIQIKNESTLRLGSTTKVFTVYLIMRLVQDSLISLEDKLMKWYPEFPNADRITIRNLMMHKSGVAEILRFPSFLLECIFNPSKEYKISELVSFLTKKGIKRAGNPNEKYEYSNSNYILLGGIAETIYEKSFGQLIDSLAYEMRLFNTSHITPKSSYNMVKGYDKNLIPFPWGYVNKPDNTSWTSLAAASGGIISNANDLSTFFNYFVHGSGLNPTTKTLIFTFEPCSHENLPEISGIGLGIFQFKLNGIEYWGHDGQMIGSESLVLYCPKNEMIFCVTGNRSAFKGKYEMISTINNFILENPTELND